MALLAFVPTVPLLAAVCTHLPPDDPRILPLAGTWTRDGDGTNGSTPVPVKIPGRLAALNEGARLSRTISLPAAFDPQEPAAIVFGGGQQVILSLGVNGRHIGVEGVPAARYKHAALALAYYQIEPGLLRAGDNLIEVRAVPEGVGLDGLASIVDHRLYLGPAALLRPYFDRAVSLQSFFELGGTFYLLLAAALVLAMTRVEKNDVDRREQMWVALVAIAVAAYLAGKSGFHNVLHLPRTLIPWSISILGMAIPGFLHWHVLRRSGRWLRFNVAVCSIQLVEQMITLTMTAYRLFIPYLFTAILASLALVLWDFVRRWPNGSPLLLSSCVCLMVAGLNDLATDMGIFSTPRLFSLAAVDMAIVTTVVIAARFMRSLRENNALLHTLAEKNEALVAALDRAEETTRLKSAFLANTSHELRTPLNSIINVPEGLLEEFSLRSVAVCAACGAMFEATAELRETSHAYVSVPCPECGKPALNDETRWLFTGDPEAAVRYLKSIQTSGRHLRAVVDDILDFSKLEAGRMTLTYARCSVRELLTKLELTLRPLAEQRDIELVITAPPTDVELTTDALKLTQVLMNLASNALKFSEEGRRVDVRAAVSEANVVFEVEDHGIGIAPADVDKVFESFRQLDSGHTRKFSGTGLGLPIAKHIVELMGGTIAVKSTLGKGSTFTVTLPRQLDAPTERRAEPAATSVALGQ